MNQTNRPIPVCSRAPDRGPKLGTRAVSWLCVAGSSTRAADVLRMISRQASWGALPDPG